MKWRGMIFSEWSIPKLLNGTKIQTRRLPRNQPEQVNIGIGHHPLWLDARAGIARNRDQYLRDKVWWKPGDRIYVKETIQYSFESDNWYYSADKLGVGQAIYRQLQGIANGRIVIPSIHCPRFAARITRQITEVRLEPLRAITVRDCLKEGVASGMPKDYFDLWDSLHGEGAAAQNPWVIVLEFEPLMEI